MREVAEETGLDIRLGPPLRDQEYTVGNGPLRPKRVHYWVGRGGGDDMSRTGPTTRSTQSSGSARQGAASGSATTYDGTTLAESTSVRKRSTPLVVLRHGRARPRKSWHGDDRERTLTKAGELQAEQIAPLLGAYGVQRVVSSSSRRCWTTVAPYADVAEIDVEVTDALTEEERDGRR